MWSARRTAFGPGTVAAAPLSGGGSLCGRMPVMSPGTFAAYLSELSDEALVELLQARPDVRIEPVPRGFAQLAQRLDNPDSLVTALHTLNRDALIVGEAIAVLDEAATLPAVARLLGAAENLVRSGADALRARGLLWESSGVLRLPERLQAHWSAEIAGHRPVGKIAPSVRVEDLRAAVTAWGGAADGLRKPELITTLNELAAEPGVLAQIVADLPAPARIRLEELRAGYGALLACAPARTARTQLPNCSVTQVFSCARTVEPRCPGKSPSRRGRRTASSS